MQEIGRPAGTLVRDYLRIVADLPEAEAARRAGVSIFTLRRWLRNPPRRLHSDIRARLAEQLRDATPARSTSP